MSTKILSTQEPTQAKIRGCLSRPKNSQYFQAILQWADSFGEPHRVSRSTKKSKENEAYHVMMQMIDELEEELRTASPGTVFVDFLQFWLDEIIIKKVEETTYNGYVLNMKNHIIPYFKPLKLRVKDVKPIHIHQFIEHELQYGGKDSGPLKSASVSRFYANLKTALDYAVSQEIIFTNPARLIKGPKSTKYNGNYLSIEQIAELWQASKNDIIFPAVFLASIYGFRRGEVCGLKWQNVNFQKKYIRIFETRTRAKTEIVKGTKNVASKRSMPLMSAVEQYLQLLLLQQKEYQTFCGSEWIDSGYVVTDEIGKPLSFNRLQKHYRKIIAAKGLPEVRFHDLRHSVATYLLEIGIPIEEVSAWLGHSSIATTAKVYAHVNIGIRKNAAKTMDKLLGFETIPEQAEDIETVLSNLFQSLLNDIKADLNSTEAPVRSEIVSIGSREKIRSEDKISFEVEFELPILSKV